MNATLNMHVEPTRGVTAARLPDFVIVGSAKAGTTTLYEYLLRHPALFMSQPKEPEFFSHDENFAKGLDWYASLFEGAAADQRVGEASTAYTCSPRYPHTFERMKAVLPDAKLVFMVREPVARAYSGYVQELKNKVFLEDHAGPPLSFEQRLEQERYYLDVSDYALQYEAMRAFYDADQIDVVVFEEFVADPASVLPRIAEHIGLTSAGDGLEHDWMTDGNVKANTTREFHDHMTDRVLRDKALSKPGAAWVRRVTPPIVRQAILQGLRQVKGKEVQSEFRCPPMRAETRSELRAYFAPRIDRFEQLTGLDLSAWKADGQGKSHS